MVQKEIRKKTRVYGIVGLLSAIVLVTLIYSFAPSGIGPFVPQTSSTVFSAMKTFSSVDELKTFLQTGSAGKSLGIYGYAPENFFVSGSDTLGTVPAPIASPQAQAAASNEASRDYSTTNVQVAGVDEADSARTDGNFVYVVANNSVYILNADPNDARVVYKFSFGADNYISVAGIYLSHDGNRLVVLGNQYVPYMYAEKLPYAMGLAPYIAPSISGSSFVNVYDVSNKAAPVLARNFTITGNYVNSRMIGNYVYGVFNENAYLINDTVILPTVYSGGQTTTIEPSEIYYNNLTDTYYSYTTIAGINLMDDAATPSELTIMMGGAGTMYVSANNIYITYQATNYQIVPLVARSDVTGPEASATSSSNSVMVPPVAISTVSAVSWQGTAIYKVHVAEDALTFDARGNVTGNVLNQYSMDESNGYFRIATTSYDYVAGDYRSIQQNNLYVLDSSLQVVGKIEDLASGENLHAARFMGDRCYLVTFMNTDPLFVIDLSQPSNPRVLGNLTMPGYSDYLYPYDATHLIGLGKDTVEDSGTGFAWYQGLKLSLFDVSDVTAPKEISRFIIGDRGTSSEALSDPKAFLFYPARNLLVLPVELHLVNGDSTFNPGAKDGSTPIMPPVPVPTTDTPSNVVARPQFVVGSIGSGSASSAYGEFVWQGAIAFNVDLTNGFVLKGNVTQIDYSSSKPDGMYYYRNDYWITRALYNNNTLYTLSNSRVQLNDLNTFTTIAKVDLR